MFRKRASERERWEKKRETTYILHTSITYVQTNKQTKKQNFKSRLTKKYTKISEKGTVYTYLWFGEERCEDGEGGKNR